MKKFLALCILLLSLVPLMAGCRAPDDITAKKPVIYLYPTEKTEINIKIDYSGQLACTYPEYDREKGWTVIAEPDGTLTEPASLKTYSYLFWEGTDNIDYDMSKGFVVSGDETAGFLQSTLSEMGLTPREYNEFIVYWLPQMQNNPYNLITFQAEAYTENAVLNVSPKPDSVLRVFMAWKAIDKPVEIAAQDIVKFERSGFTLVEWGGTEIKQ